MTTPKIEMITEAGADELQFRLSGVNVSIANALRRILLSDIPLVVFRVSPHEKSKCTVLANTCGLNNEIVKHRLSCIPIHLEVDKPVRIGDDEVPLEDCIMEVHVENRSDTTMVVTTRDFVVRSKSAPEKRVNDENIRSIFPTDSITDEFIDFVRLKGRASEEIPVKSIHLTCEFDVGTAKEDGAYNAVSTCSYGNTVDELAQTQKLQLLKQEWRDAGKDLEFEEKNWRMLEGKRIFVKDSFDFVLQTACVYTNEQLLVLACMIMVQKLHNLQHLIVTDKLQIKNAETTMAHSFDIVLDNEDYTLGKVIEYFAFTEFYETKILTFCGFKMLHPHDAFSIIRLAYKDLTTTDDIKGHISQCIHSAINVFEPMQREFLRYVDRRR